MKTIQFEIPEGFEVDNFDKATGKVSLKPKPLELGKITTFEQVCERMNEDPKDYEVTESHPRKKGHQILARILLIIECFQAGAKLDVYNTDQRKYQGWYDVSKGSPGFRFDASAFTCTDADSVLGPLLSLQDDKTCEYVHTTFADEFKAFVELTNNK